MIDDAGNHEQRAFIQRMRQQESHGGTECGIRTKADQHGQSAQCHDRGIGQHFLDAGAAQRQPDADKQCYRADATEYRQP